MTRNKRWIKIYCALAFILIVNFDLYGQGYLISFRHTTDHGNDYYYYYLTVTNSDSNDHFMIKISDKKYSMIFLRAYNTIFTDYAVCCCGRENIDKLLGDNNQEALDSIQMHYYRLENDVKKTGLGIKEMKMPNIKKKLNAFDLVRVYKIKAEFCNCEVTGFHFSTLTNQLIMLKSIPKFLDFNREEILIFKKNISFIINSAFIQSTLPDSRKYLK